MTRNELQQKYTLGGHAQMLADIAHFLREASPFVAQLGMAMDETTALRQLGRHEGWFAACQILATVHESEQARQQKPPANYSEPPRVVTEPEKK